MNDSIFISYRRGRSEAAAGRLYDQLADHFGHDRVFMDVDKINPGEDFIKIIYDHLAKCGAFIAVIGPGWQDEIGQDGKRRLDNPHDFVRLEIEAALERDIRVIPVLVDGAAMPKAQNLPESLQPLMRRNAIELVHHRFGAEVDEVAKLLKSLLGPKHPTQVTSEGWQGKPGRKFPPSQQSGSLATLLFSFEGRISRKTFWLCLTALLLTMMALQTAFILVFGESWKVGYDPVTRAALSFKMKITVYLFIIPLLWPGLAAGLKRLHDFGAGWGLLIFQNLLLLAVFIADISVALTQGNPHQHGMSIVYYYILGGMWLITTIMVGSLKGTEGPNKYGPDPLAQNDQSEL